MPLLRKLQLPPVLTSLFRAPFPPLYARRTPPHNHLRNKIAFTPNSTHPPVLALPNRDLYRRPTLSLEMRGSPLLRALIAFLILAALGLPLHRLLQADEAPLATNNIPETTVPEAIPVPTADTLHLQVSFTTPPSRLQLNSLGQPIWQEARPTAEMERDLPIPFPPEGIELQFQATWPADLKAAARLRLTDPQGVSYERVVWAAGETSAVLSFP
jgi:hypothetical protein